MNPIKVYCYPAEDYDRGVAKVKLCLLHPTKQDIRWAIETAMDYNLQKIRIYGEDLEDILNLINDDDRVIICKEGCDE
jgi:hypothetical protein